MAKDVIVIGGGITGIGIARDLAMRGLDVSVLERGKIGAETSTHFHGMLHSGARYAVSDPYAAKKCMDENRILRDIAEDYIEFTEGLFVKLEGDSEKYYQKKINACKKCGIPVEEIKRAQLNDNLVSNNVEKAFKVPDGVIKPIKLLQANVKSAEENGAKIIENAEVKEIVRKRGSVKGVKYVKEGENLLQADFVVNATGPWAEKTGRLADVNVRMSPTKGVLTVIDNPGINKILNRCRPTDSGDIIIPNEDAAIIGTTSREVEDPDSFPREKEEEELMIEQGSKILDQITQEDLRGSYWGLRPLYNPTDAEKQGRDITREFRLIDHEEKDNLDNMASVVGGKWTTYRYMAEKTSDLICEKLHIDRDSQTAEVSLPKNEKLRTVDRSWPPTGN